VRIPHLALSQWPQQAFHHVRVRRSRSAPVPRRRKPRPCTRGRGVPDRGRLPRRRSNFHPAAPEGLRLQTITGKRSDGPPRGATHVVRPRSPTSARLVVHEKWKLGGPGQTYDASATIHLNSGKRAHHRRIGRRSTSSATDSATLGGMEERGDRPPPPNATRARSSRWRAAYCPRNGLVALRLGSGHRPARRAFRRGPALSSRFQPSEPRHGAAIPRSAPGLASSKNVRTADRTRPDAPVPGRSRRPTRSSASNVIHIFLRGRATPRVDGKGAGRAPAFRRPCLVTYWALPPWAGGHTPPASNEEFDANLKSRKSPNGGCGTWRKWETVANRAGACVSRKRSRCRRTTSRWCFSALKRSGPFATRHGDGDGDGRPCRERNVRKTRGRSPSAGTALR